MSHAALPQCSHLVADRLLSRPTWSLGRKDDVHQRVQALLVDLPLNPRVFGGSRATLGTRLPLEPRWRLAKFRPGLKKQDIGESNWIVARIIIPVIDTESEHIGYGRLAVDVVFETRQAAVGARALADLDPARTQRVWSLQHHFHIPPTVIAGLDLVPPAMRSLVTDAKFVDQFRVLHCSSAFPKAPLGWYLNRHLTEFYNGSRSCTDTVCVPQWSLCVLLSREEALAVLSALCFAGVVSLGCLVWQYLQPQWQVVSYEPTDCEATSFYVNNDGDECSPWVVANIRRNKAIA